MKTRIQGGLVTLLVLLFAGGLAFGAVAQWQLGQQVFPPPRLGTYFALSRGTNAPPLPGLPPVFKDAAVYELAGKPGSYVYDDSGYDYAQAAAQRLVAENDTGEEDASSPDGPTPGGPLYLLTGPTNIVNGLVTAREAWMLLTNTHYGVYYQLANRASISPGTPWQVGQLVQDTGTSHQVRFSNVSRDNPPQKFYRGAGGATIASIGLDPDLNLAVAPSTSGGSGQGGKFVVSVNTNTGAGLTVIYQVSGSASNGVDYASLSGAVTISSGLSAEIPITPLYNQLAGLDASVTLTLVLTNEYLVNPNAASATMKIYPPRPAGMAVAIHDSGWTKLNGLSTTNWNYFVLPESVKEALRSDGTPYVVVSDLDIANGVLLNTNGTPKYPILISLAAEAIRDDEIAPLATYVTNGGFILAGSSSFTRYTNGTYRPNFALASQMGLGCSPSALNWYDNTNLTKQVNHRLVGDIPDGRLVWRMPTSPEETSWGSCLTHSLYCNGRGFDGPHQIWWVTNSSAQVLAVEDGAYPYIAVKAYGSGCFVYDAAVQPLIGHGGFAPGMYAYMIFRRAIEWAFESAQRPVVKLSPWPYQYDAAFMIRHDLEDYANEISEVAASAYIEFTNGAKGDYYFCTGRITNEANYASIVSGLQTAVGSYGATIGPHNGGLPNPRATTNTSSCCFMNIGTYEYWHWGPDEGLDLPGGKDYVSNSLAISFAQIETWLTNQTNSPRVWVAPYFNATREDSYEMQAGLNVKITGDQKLTPFPAFTLSPRKDGKRYELLSEPTSDWFVGGSLAQSLDPWHAPGIHTTNTMHDGVDFYYTNGFLINFYAHGLSTGDQGPKPYPLTAGYLIPDYIQYCMNAQRFPRLWSSNARGVYDWWLKRSTAQIVANYGTSGTHSVATVAITGATDTDTSIEILASGFGSAAVSQLVTNGVTNSVAATANNCRTIGELIKVRVGATVTNVQLEYFPGPIARDDVYTMVQGQALTVSTNGGVLTNDFSGTWPGLAAITSSIPLHGSLEWNANHDGGFTYRPGSGFWGTECFTYYATDGATIFGTGTVTVCVIATNGLTADLFSDDFVRCTGTAITPWQTAPAPWAGQWSLGGGVMEGNHAGEYGFAHLSAAWSDFSVEAQVSFASGSFGGGLGGRVDSSGGHYAAWLYPGVTPGSSNVLKLVNFYNWTDWGTNGVNNHAAMKETNLLPIGTGWHPLKLVCSNSVLQVYYHGTNVMSFEDPISPVHSTGSVSLDVYNGSISVSNLIVAPIP